MFHIRLKNAPNCQYLNNSLSIKELHEDFVKNVTACCYSKYREIFASGNIGFTPPSSDKCDLCLTFKTCSDTANHSSEDCKECCEISQHPSFV